MAEIPLSQAKQDTGLSVAYIARLIKAERVKGRKIGPIWLVDSESLAEYTRQYHKPGPKPKQQEGEQQQEGALARIG